MAITINAGSWLVLSAAGLAARASTGVSGFSVNRARTSRLRRRGSSLAASTRRKDSWLGSSSTGLPNDLEKDNDDDEEEEESATMGAWVPVGSVSSLAGLMPTKIELMDRKFAVWCGSSGRDEAAQNENSSYATKWSVVDDECPHRMAPLSLGRIDPVTQLLECPYHGWRFDVNGTIQCIPQLDDEKNHANRNKALLQAPSSSVKSYPTHLTGDLLWMFLPTSVHGESFPRTLLPEDYYDGLRRFMRPESSFYCNDLPFSFDFLVENGLDGPYHAYFAHHKLGFDRSEAGPIPSSIVESNFTHLTSEVNYKRKGRERLRRYGFQRPFLVSNQQPTSNGGWQSAILFFIVPIREGQSRLITTLDTLKPHPLAPDWMLHVLNRRFLEGDLMIHNAEIAIRKKQSTIPNYIHASSADASTKAWRKWWSRYGLSTAPPHTFGPASPSNIRQFSRRELVDPWRAHTSKCSKCRKALRRIKLVQRSGWIVAWFAALLLRRNSLVGAILLGMLGLLSGLAATLLIRELEGPLSASEVPDRGLSVSL